MWKENGKTTTLLLFLDSLFPETEKNAGYFFWIQNTPEVSSIQQEEDYFY
jgi:hypothetical protein